MFKNIFKKLGQIIRKKKEPAYQITKPKGIISRVKAWFKPNLVRPELPKPIKLETPKIHKPERIETEKKILDALKRKPEKIIETGGTFVPPTIKEPTVSQPTTTKANLIEDYIGIELEVQKKIVERNKGPGYEELLAPSKLKLKRLEQEKRRLEGMTAEEIKKYIGQKKQAEKDLKDKLKKVRIQERDRKGWDPEEEEWIGYSV